MRVILAAALLIVLAGCSAGPGSLGITGPGGPPPPPPASPPGQTPDTSPNPGVSTTGTSYGPSIGPATGQSGFWGYN